MGVCAEACKQQELLTKSRVSFWLGTNCILSLTQQAQDWGPAFPTCGIYKPIYIMFHRGPIIRYVCAKQFLCDNFPVVKFPICSTLPTTVHFYTTVPMDSLGVRFLTPNDYFYIKQV